MLVTEFVILIGILLLLIIYEPLGSTLIILVIGAIGILFSSKLKKKAEFKNPVFTKNTMNNIDLLADVNLLVEIL
jgi:hypothetical protein